MRKCLVSLLCIVAYWAAGDPFPAGPAVARAQQKWAVLSAVEQYRHTSPLRYTINDVQQIALALTEYGSYRADNILQLLETDADERFHPTRSNFKAQVQDWLAKPKHGDHILIFFSGHGYRDDSGRLYLTPIDFDPRETAETGIPIQWLREQIAACNASFKLVVLDTCFAGSERGQADDPAMRVTAKELAEPFRDLSGVVTLGSSTADEVSWVWSEMKQSLFTYWLVQGLKGHADANADSRLTIDELYDYVHRNVTRISRDYFPQQQTPVRIVRSGTPGVPVVVHLRPRDSLKQVIAGIAERLVSDVKLNGLSTLGVLEFTVESPLGEALGSDFGLLGRYCAVELERQLLERSGKSFQVVNRRHLQAALERQQFALRDLGSTERLRALADDAGGVQAVAIGTLQNRTGRLVNLSCTLGRTDEPQTIAIAGGAAKLNESEWAMLGRSVAVDPNDFRPRFPAEDQAVQPVSVAAIDAWDNRSQDAHPLADPQFPYRVRIKVDGQERKPVFLENDMYVALRRDEVFEIEVENRSGEVALLRLLVDGLNTLPERVPVKAVKVEPTIDYQYLPAQPVNLAEARHWVLDPRDATGALRQRPVWSIRGFVIETGSAGRIREFKIVDAQESVGARQNFTEQLGLITAAFYSDGHTGPRGIGTGFGEERQEDLRRYYRATRCGPLLGVVHVRYAEPEVLNQIVGRRP